MADDTTTGATPGAGATPAQAGQTTTTPAATGATPPAGTTAPAAAAPSATDDAALGEAGKRILAEARRAAKDAEARAQAAESERDALRAATQSEAEKALTAAVKEAEDRVRGESNQLIRGLRLEVALVAAGLPQAKLPLAMGAPEFAGLRVTADGSVNGLDDAVKAFTKAYPELFAKPAAPVGDAGGGVRGTAPTRSTQIASAVADGDYRTSIALKNRQLREAAAKP